MALFDGHGLKPRFPLLVPYFIALLLVMFMQGGSGFDIINAISWVSGGIAYSIALAYLLDIV